MSNRIFDGQWTAADVPERPADSGESQNLSDAALAQLDRVRANVEQFIASHPAICLGVAVAAGIAFGWWVKRR